MRRKMKERRNQAFSSLSFSRFCIFLTVVVIIGGGDGSAAAAAVAVIAANGFSNSLSFSLAVLFSSSLLLL